MPDGSDVALSRERPWPGMRPYQESDAGFFFGRGAEIADLVARVERSLLTLLYGRGGLGKTSLLRAGLAPRLAERGFLAVYVRPRGLIDGARDPVAEVIHALEVAAQAAHLEATAAFAAPSLWELFHRESFDLWDASNRLVTPVLVFDQFEEIFQILDDDASAAPRIKQLLHNIAELVENRLPTRLAADDLPADAAHRFDIASKDYRVILSFREDYLPHIRKLRTVVPSVIENHVRLEALSGPQAFEVVANAGGSLIDSAAATLLVRGVGRRAGLLQTLLESTAAPQPGPGGSLSDLEVDPAILCVVCSYLNAERQKRGQSVIDVGLVQLKKPEDIFDEYYLLGIDQVDTATREFVETRLVTPGGERVLYPMRSVEAHNPAIGGHIDHLLQQGILRKEWFAGEQRLEIGHDLLLRPIRRAIDRRNALQARKTFLWRAGTAMALFLVLVGGVWQKNRLDLRAEAEKRELVLNAELKKREDVAESLLIAYVPLKPDEKDPEALKNRMVELIVAAEQVGGGAAGVQPLQALFAQALAFSDLKDVHPITGRRLREVAVEYVQLRVDGSKFTTGELQPLVRLLRDAVDQLCAGDFAQAADRKVAWFADNGGLPPGCK